jgi:hypothetical protein
MVTIPDWRPTRLAPCVQSKDLVAALHKAVAEAFSTAPPLPVLLPGEVAWLAASSALDTAREAERFVGPVGLDRGVAAGPEVASTCELWASMLRCLRGMPVDFLLQLTQVSGQGFVAEEECSRMLTRECQDTVKALIVRRIGQPQCTGTQYYISS